MSFDSTFALAEFPTLLLRATLWTIAAWCLLRGALRAMRSESPRAQRWAGWIVLAQGWAVAPVLVIAVPWYAPEDATGTNRWSGRGAQVAAGESFEFSGTFDSRGAISARSDGRESGSASPAARGWGSTASFGAFAHRMRSLLPWLWCVGATTAAGVFVASYASFVWRTRGSRGNDAEAENEDAAEWAAEWRRTLVEQGVRRAIPLRVSESFGPMLCLSPRGYELWVPRSFWLACSSAQREAILRHELSHWRRGDVWKSWLAYALAIPQWFNPVAWSAVASIRQAGEWLSDQDAAETASGRDDFLGALVRLAECKTPTSTAAGLCAHAHPLLVRVRRLLSPQVSKDSNMKKFLFASLVVALALAPVVRFQLVARAAEAPSSLQAVKERMEQLDRKLSDVKDAVGALKSRGEELKGTVGEKVKQVKALAENPATISEDLKKRVALFESGEEPKQLEALQGIEKLASRDEALLACGQAAKDSTHAAVRQRALAAAVSFGNDGYAAIAMAYEGLGVKDRVYLAKELGKRNSPDNVLFFALMTKEADEELRKTLFDLELPPSQRILFLSAIAESQMNDAFYDHLVSVGSRMEGEPGLLLLYAMAKSGPDKQAAAAVDAAAKRKEEAWPVIAAAYKNAHKATRGAVVRAAKQLGGEAGDFVVKSALADSDVDLRAAAEEAAK